ncbi:hypothetical protein RclHR1_03580003 [Rhizophagus clarus]|uniref:Uncharacterized protein n=1 Tax=Rhizophagus clarus TaxID=94130 RepID=A0A2Z6S5V5_9GLOM|nr:hypothetical protein RclHR1_03580003 [Rhizophagus clarus]
MVRHRSKGAKVKKVLRRIERKKKRKEIQEKPNHTTRCGKCNTCLEVKENYKRWIKEEITIFQIKECEML